LPKYTYKCINCQISFDCYHSAKDVKTNCNDCGESLKRVPGKFSSFKVSDAGKVVKKSIKEFQEDLNNQKKEIQNKLWSADE